MPKGIPGSVADHGTSTRYYGGCRCEPCRAAGAVYARAFRARKYGMRSWAEYQATRPRAQHGTEGMYVKHGCRCDPCRQAANEARRKRRHADIERANQHDRDYRWLTHYG